MRIIGWAPDSASLCFYCFWAYDGWDTPSDGSHFQALDLDTGDRKSLVPGCCMAFFFLPDMSKVAFAYEGRIGIYDIGKGDDRSVDIRSGSIEQAGYIHWSPSGDGLVFIVLVDDLANAKEIYLDTKSIKQKVVLKAFIEGYRFHGRTETGSPRYLKANRESGEAGPYEIVVFDPKTAALLAVGTPAPKP